MTSAISDVADDEEVRPVSTSGNLHITGRFKRLALFNETGSKVMETTNEYVNTAGLKPGIYIAQINHRQDKTSNQKST